MDRERYYRGNGVIETRTGAHQVAKGEVDGTRIVVSYNPRSELGRTFSVHITAGDSETVTEYRDRLNSSITEDCELLGGAKATCYQYLADDAYRLAESNGEALSNELDAVVSRLFDRAA